MTNKTPPEPDCDCPVWDGALAWHSPNCAITKWRNRAPDTQVAPSPLPRDANAYAIEHGGYLADAADALLEAANRLHESAEITDGPASYDAIESYSDHARGLRNAVYEFRKRADRAKTSPQVAPDSLVAPEAIESVLLALDKLAYMGHDATQAEGWKAAHIIRWQRSRLERVQQAADVLAQHIRVNTDPATDVGEWEAKWLADYDDAIRAEKDSA